MRTQGLESSAPGRLGKELHQTQIEQTALWSLSITDPLGVFGNLVI